MVEDVTFVVGWTDTVFDILTAGTLQFAVEQQLVAIAET